MGTIFLAFLFVILIPLAEGVLLALFLRELYNKYPLPLDAIIEIVDDAEPAATISAKGASTETEPAAAQDGEPQGGTAPNAADTSAQWDFSQSDGEMSESDILSQMGVPTFTPSAGEEPQGADTLPPPNGVVDVFDNAGSIPVDLPIADALNAMMAASPSHAPNDLDNLVEQRETEGMQDIQNQIDSSGDNDDTNESEASQIAALREAMPQETIDFGAEQAEREAAGQMSETAKELLGADFNVDKLLNPALSQESAEAALVSIQNLEPGLVQVQTSGLSAADVSQFFFTEESPPMFVRKRRKK